MLDWSPVDATVGHIATDFRWSLMISPRSLCAHLTSTTWQPLPLTPWNTSRNRHPTTVIARWRRRLGETLPVLLLMQSNAVKYWSDGPRWCLTCNYNRCHTLALQVLCCCKSRWARCRRSSNCKLTLARPRTTTRSDDRSEANGFLIQVHDDIDVSSVLPERSLVASLSRDRTLDISRLTVVLYVALTAHSARQWPPAMRRRTTNVPAHPRRSSLPILRMFCSHRRFFITGCIAARDNYCYIIKRNV